MEGATYMPQKWEKRFEQQVHWIATNIYIYLGQHGCTFRLYRSHHQAAQ